MDYLNEELVCAFGSGPVQASWKGIPAPERLQLITLNVPQLFYEGFHKHAGDSAAQLLQAFPDKYILLDKDYYRHINFLRLNEAEKRLIQPIDGQHRPGELVGSEMACGPLLLTLANLNMARFAAQPTPSANPRDLPLRALFDVVEEEIVASEESLESFSALVDDTETIVNSDPLAPETKKGLDTGRRSAIAAS